MTATSELKFYATRDSAVAVLRKAGIEKAAYNNFLVVKDGKYAPDLNAGYGDKQEEDERAANGLKKMAAEAKAPATSATQELIANAEAKAEVADIIAKAKARNAANVKALATPFTGLGAKPETSTLVAAAKKAPAKKAAAKGKGKKAPAKEASGEKNVGISEWIRSQITAGKSNAEILEMSEKAGFDLTGKKRYFPAWYRFDMKKKAEAAKNATK